MVRQAIGSRALRNVVTPVKVGVLVVLGLVAFFVFLSFIQDEGAGGDLTEYSAVFSDASGLAPRTQVRVAGIPVGEISRIELEGGRARVFFRVRSDIRIYPNAKLAKRSASILGDYVLDLNPGSPTPATAPAEGTGWTTPGGARIVPTGLFVPAQARAPAAQPIPPGGEIPNVQEAVQIERIFESMDRITGDIEVITRSLRETLAGEDASVARIVENLDRVAARLDTTLAQSSEQLDRILANAEAITGDVRALTAAKDDEVGQIITNIRVITEQTREVMASVQSIVGENEGDLKESVGGIKEALASLNRSLENVEEVTERIERGEGALGVLVADKELGDKLGDAIYDASDYVSRLAALQIEINLRSEYLINEEGAKNYVQLRLIPRPDSWFVFEAIDDPRGFITRETVVRSPPGSEEVANQEVRITRDVFKFSAQFAKRFGFGAVRFGLIESTGGVGGNLFFLDDHLVLNFDLFEFANPEKDYPRLKAYANLLFLSHLFVTAGIDDAINAPITEAATGRILAGRDYFVGGGIYFTDDDLKLLFGVPVPGLQ